MCAPVLPECQLRKPCVHDKQPVVTYQLNGLLVANLTLGQRRIDRGN